MDRQEIIARCALRIRKEIRKLSLVWKHIVFLAGITLLVGCSIGMAIGALAEQKKSDEKVASAIAKVEKTQQDKLEQMQKELEKIEEEEEKPWNLVLVNDEHSMEEGYMPDLAEVTEGYSVDSRIAEAAKQMLAVAKEQGMHIVLCSAYRSVERQESIFNECMNEHVRNGMSYWEAYDETSRSVAEPGTSEHALGLALDLISNQYSELDDRQEHTKEAKWLKDNCYKYGFILRYPPEKTEITGIIYEPWHYRYVGVEHATKIMELGITLEEYLEGYYQPEGGQ